MTTPADIFAKTAQNLIADKAGDMNAAVSFDLSGENGGQWTVWSLHGYQVSAVLFNAHLNC